MQESRYEEQRVFSNSAVLIWQALHAVVIIVFVRFHSRYELHVYCEVEDDFPP